MKIPYYHVDAFTKTLFAGNPAGVCLLDRWLDDGVMRRMAAENGLAETAFLTGGNGEYRIRWFTPEIEMDLCGHATLAAAHVVHGLEGRDQVVFHSRTDRLDITVRDGLIIMMLPRRVPVPAEAPALLRDSVNISPREVLKSRDFIFVYPEESQVRDIRINTETFNRMNLDPGGLCVCAPGIEADFVSRYFTPQSTILEDPVTGSAHCSLVPYWAARLGKSTLRARQISPRTGDLYCRDGDDRVEVAGYAVTYKTGEIHLEG